MQNFLDKLGLSYFWQKIKTYIDNQISDTVNNAIGDIDTILDEINGEDV